MASKTKAQRPASDQKAGAKKKTKAKRLTLPALSDDQLREFVIAFADGRIFTTAHIPEGQAANLVHLIFMPAALGAFSGVPKRDLKNIGVLWEYIAQAEPRSINGYPMFMNCRMLNKNDWARARKAIALELERRKEIHV